MVTRKEFGRSCAACAAGLCASVSQSEQSKDSPQTRDPKACDPKELQAVQTRVDAARDRFSKLIEEIDSSLPEKQRKELLHRLGGRCADAYRSQLLDRYKGDIHGFLQEGLRTWMKEAHYDEAKGLIRVVDRSATCSCPMVREGKTPPTFCDCTLGWQEAAYSAVLGIPVKAELKESILRGDKRCVFEIRVI
jgi:predicted ArsR family transcriptional regulator